MNDATPVTLHVNGTPRQVLASPRRTLLEALREQLLLTGSKRGCNQGVCGACSVLLDGEVVRSCLSIAVNCAGREITTIEGLADGRNLSPVQQAFLDAGAVQCGFCMPGMIVAATALLDRTPAPDDAEIRDGLSGNLCRCSGYAKVVEAVRLAAERTAA